MRACLALTAIAISLATAACGGSAEPRETQPVATRTPTPFEEMLEELPNDEALPQRLLFGDLARLRAAYPEPDAFSRAVSAVRLPDALAGAAKPAWARQFGFGLKGVRRFLAGGLHPLELTVIAGQFEPKMIRRRLRQAGYRRHRALWQRGADSSVDRSTAAGRLARSSLDRVDVTRDKLVAASTTALAHGAITGATTLASSADVRLAAHALGEVTAAVVLPRELVPQPPSGGAREIAMRRASFLAVGIDDGGPAKRTIRIALVYPSAADAEAERARFASKLASSALPSRGDARFGDVLHGLTVTTNGGRVLVVSGRVDDAAVWRRLLEDGDLATLVIGASESG